MVQVSLIMDRASGVNHHLDCQPGQGICTDMRTDLGPWLGGVHSAEYGTPSASSRWA